MLVRVSHFEFIRAGDFNAESAEIAEMEWERPAKYTKDAKEEFLFFPAKHAKRREKREDNYCPRITLMCANRILIRGH